MTSTKKNTQKIVSLISKLKNSQEIEDFVTGFLTQQEIEQLALRFEIVKRLKKGEAQRKIAEDLGVGIATVTRGSKELQNGRFSYIN